MDKQERKTKREGRIRSRVAYDLINSGAYRHKVEKRGVDYTRLRNKEIESIVEEEMSEEWD
jgi:hypothetical protein